MFAFVTKSASIASLAIAALPFVALGVAHAQPATVRISDLDLSRAASAQVVNGRIDIAADRFCSEQRELARQAACKSAVRAELKEKAAAARMAMDQARVDALTVASR